MNVSSDQECAPVCLFVYNRLEEVKQTVTFLKGNYLTERTILYIFSDGPRNENDAYQIEEVRKYIRSIIGFKEVRIEESGQNKGLANSIIDGTTKVINQHGRVIVLEDDLLTSPSFLEYMNQALNFYESQKQIFSISGYTSLIKFPDYYHEDHYFSVRASSWGWATWKDRWDDVDWKVSDYKEFVTSKEMQQSFNKGGSDLTRMLKNQIEGKINSWAIRWCYHQWKSSQLTVYPTTSKVKNIGFKDNASNTKHRVKEFEADLDLGQKTEFAFSNNIFLNDKIASLFIDNYSIKRRIKSKLLSYFHKLTRFKFTL